jgi:hypothetical protein
MCWESSHSTGFFTSINITKLVINRKPMSTKFPLIVSIYTTSDDKLAIYKLSGKYRVRIGKGYNLARLMLLVGLPQIGHESLPLLLHATHPQEMNPFAF